MAIDEWLLDAAMEQPSGAAGPVLRFYRWQRPTLSLGFHQRQLEPHWWGLVEQGSLDLVRRPSGGRAVLHAGDLTYALIWPDPPGRRVEAYRQACHWLRQAFNDLGLPLDFGRQSASPQRSSCFASGTAADLLHPCGAKRIGSAQLWRRGGLLQHGTILVDPPTALWRQVFGSDPPLLPHLGLPINDLISQLRHSAARHLPMAPAGAALELDSRALGAEELAAMAPRLDRYRPTPSMTPSTSPDLTMARAT